MKKQRAGLAAVWTAAVTVVAPEAAARDWTADANGCKVWNTQPAMKETVAWSGGCVDGFAEGKGQLRWTVKGKPTRAYEGDMKAGRRSGQGVQTEPSGTRYEGGFLNDTFSGQGSLRYPNGTSSRGRYVSGLLEGDCTLTWPEGARYEGQCKSGHEAGEGTVTFKNGDRYVGAVRYGQPAGQGRYQWKRGDSYEGGFTDGRPAGLGIYRFADGRLYEGDFYDGLPSGSGRVELPDGLGYDGSFLAGKLVAPGSFFKTGAKAPKDSLQLRAKLNLPYAKPLTLSAKMEPVPHQPERVTQVLAPPAPVMNVAPSRRLTARMVCTTMGQPQLPPLNWTGDALFRVIAVVKDGRVVSVETAEIQPVSNPAVKARMVESIERALKETYVCPGNLVFEQEFQFKYD